MANADSATHYQLYETYYKKAREADNGGRLKEAKAHYLLASEALLRAAKNITGETRNSMMNRADRLQLLADSIQLPPETASSVSKSVNISGGKSAASGRISNQGDESETVWLKSDKPNIHFSDIAGLAAVKESVNMRVIQPMLHPDVYKAFHRKLGGGILLYGPPGTGKTMIAKAIATEINMDFYSVRCSDIVGKYFGEAEKNVKSLFDTARAAGSAILFFDEFEALATQRGGNSTVMNRLVPELLSQIDGFTSTKDQNLLLLASTNRPWDIDTAFLRPPRLTEKIYVGLPDYEARLYLVEKAIREIPRDDEVDAGEIANATEGFNAADVVELCEAIKDPSIQRSIQARVVNGNDAPLSNVTRDDVASALTRVRSSVQKKDIDAIRRWEASQHIA